MRPCSSGRRLAEQLRLGLLSALSGRGILDVLLLGTAIPATLLARCLGGGRSVVDLQPPSQDLVGRTRCIHSGKPSLQLINQGGKV